MSDDSELVDTIITIESSFSVRVVVYSSIRSIGDE